MNLFVDIGNHRVKWATDRGAGGVCELPPADWRCMRELEPRAVWASCVARAPVADEFGRYARRHWSLAPNFVRARRAQCGVINRYADAETLGNDRWAALIGARALCGAHAAIVLDAGTAITIDALDADGVFRGGVILPGWHSMHTALAAHTRIAVRDALSNAGESSLRESSLPESKLTESKLTESSRARFDTSSSTGDDEGNDASSSCAQFDDSSSTGGDESNDASDYASDYASDDTSGDATQTALATNTGAAIAAGARLAVRGGVGEAIARQRVALGGAVRLLITGGDGAAMARQLSLADESMDGEVVEGLVLRGVREIALRGDQ